MDWQNMAGQMLTAAKESAGTSWTSIRTIAKHEFEVLAKRFASIAEAVATQQINKGTARLLYRNAKNQIIAVLAMLSKTPKMMNSPPTIRLPSESSRTPRHRSDLSRVRRHPNLSSVCPSIGWRI